MVCYWLGPFQFQQVTTCFLPSSTSTILKTKVIESVLGTRFAISMTLLSGGKFVQRPYLLPCLISSRLEDVKTTLAVKRCQLMINSSLYLEFCLRSITQYTSLANSETKRHAILPCQHQQPTRSTNFTIKGKNNQPQTVLPPFSARTLGIMLIL